jgi:uncharacterized membrane protein YkoI
MKRMITIGVVAAGLIAGGAGIAFATGNQDSSDGSGDKPITGATLEKATKAALEHTGGGRVTETEAGGEDNAGEGYYEVEVTLGGGRQVDVHLDEHFTVLGTTGDAGDGSDAGR